MKLNLNSINDLAKSVKENNLTELVVEVEGVKVTLKKEEFQYVAKEKKEPMTSVVYEEKKIENIEKKSEIEMEQIDGEEIKSPMVGNFYSAPAPGAQPFVKKGDKVKKDDVLCIVEAMKMMNEVKSPIEGTVLDICVKDKTTVKKGDVLFIIG